MDLKFDQIISAGNLVFGLTEDKKIYLLMPKRTVVSQDKKSTTITSASWQLGPTTDDPATVKVVGIEEGL